MVKRVITLMLILMSIIALIGCAYERPEEIMEGNQKALFIGKIVEVSAGSYIITPSTIMMGNMEQPEIKVARFHQYRGGGQNDKPQVEDIIVAVLLEGNKIDEEWVFKATTEDYKTLELVGAVTVEEKRYEKFINEGRYIKAQNEPKGKYETFISNLRKKAMIYLAGAMGMAIMVLFIISHLRMNIPKN